MNSSQERNRLSAVNLSFSAFKSKSRRLTEEEAALVVSFWSARLNLSQEIHLERISPFQVTRENGLPGSSLVGIEFDAKNAVISHTRSLTAEDIVHELLHAAQPTWPEKMVVEETARLLNTLTSTSGFKG